MIVSWDQDSGLIRLFFYLLSTFLAFYKLTLKIFVRVFLGSIEAKVFELGVCIDDKLYHGINYQAHCCYSICPIICLFKVNLCHSFLRNYWR